LTYDRDEPQEFEIKHYDTYKSKLTIEAPEKYIIPQAWTDVIERLQSNGVHMYPLEKDTIMLVNAYHILDYTSPEKPYEGHYLHDRVQVASTEEYIQFYRGDFWIPLNQRVNRYIIETLEPQSTDSFFAWNFFDSTLQQKEWFSDYVFEDRAIEILRDNPDLKEEYETFINENPKMNHWAQLYWLYKKSGYFENSFNRYPVYRINY